MNMIKNYEELSFAEWPAHETLFYDNWIIRLSKGYTKRANSVNSIYGNGSIDLNEKVDFCEKIFEQANIKPTFKLTGLEELEKLDSLLEDRGYKIVEPSLVMRLELNKSSDVPDMQYIKYSNLDAEWLETYASLKKLSTVDTQNFKFITERISGDVFHVTIRNGNNEVAGVGSGAIQRGYLGILNIHTAEHLRGKGYGRKIMGALLYEGARAGAVSSYLQVVEANTPAVQLYFKCGYEKVYTYWYRVKNTD
jgi:N-acetylglutamate synthase